MGRFRPLLQRHGLTEQQWRVIRVLAERVACDATELASASCIHAASLSRILPALQQSRYLVASPSRVDSRRLVVELTLEGQKRFVDVGAESEAIYRELEQEVGLKELQETLDRINRLADRLARPKSSATGRRSTKSKRLKPSS
jgi:homoprotocatechuate degradation regulator HpaR